jgi:hypothetical protein
MRKILVALLLGLGVAMPALAADVRVNIGINVPAYPVLQRIPNYPVYYAPSLQANYFFYDGLYWVFDGQEWYASSWYNGPWHFVDRYSVPVYLLRVPVRYYRYAPATFHAWSANAAPHWGVYWGSTWASRRAGWDRWDQRSAPAPAPLPVYQRAYTRDRYPRLEEQATIQSRNYRYQPREQVAREVVRDRRVLAEARTSSASPDHAVARGQIRDERGMPEHAQGKARGRDRDERGMPEHAQGKGKGRDKD